MINMEQIIIKNKEIEEKFNYLVNFFYKDLPEEYV
jgi:hypothetical protein